MMLYDHYSLKLVLLNGLAWGAAYRLRHEYVTIETLNILRNTLNKLDG